MKETKGKEMKTQELKKAIAQVISKVLRSEITNKHYQIVEVLPSQIAVMFDICQLEAEYYVSETLKEVEGAI